MKARLRLAALAWVAVGMVIAAAAWCAPAGKQVLLLGTANVCGAVAGCG